MNSEEKSSYRPVVLIVGAGAWGTAIANVFAKGGCTVYLWDKDDRLILSMQQKRRHPTFSPDIPLETTVFPIAALDGLKVECTVFVAPFQNLREAALLVSERGVRSRFVMSASKGIERESLLLGHQIIAAQFSDLPFAQMSGPSFAREVMVGSPTAITVGTESEELFSFVCNYLHTKSFRLYRSSDVTGVEVGGALKNVIAIAAGIADGLKLGSSARSALIVRGLTEMSRYGARVGAEKTTFMGLSGLGDLVLTCSDDQSRNRQFGLKIASTEDLINVVSEESELVEGFHTAKALAEIEGINFDDFPIIFEVIAILKNVRSPGEALERLMAREPKSEDF